MWINIKMTNIKNYTGEFTASHVNTDTQFSFFKYPLYTTPIERWQAVCM